MLKIATHDSVTGEKCGNFLSYLVWPFSVTQGKSLKKQYDKGCRYFDIRVKLSKKGVWKCAHGLWTAKKTLFEILDEINAYGDKCYIYLTYEKPSNDDKLILDLAELINSKYNNILITDVNIKLPKWRYLKTYNYAPLTGDFLHLDGRSWHTWLPIPWFWKKIYYNKPKFNEEVYSMVDFL